MLSITPWRLTPARPEKICQDAVIRVQSFGFLVASSAKSFDCDGAKRRCSEPKQPPCALLGICDRVICVEIPVAPPYRRLRRAVLDAPKTLGEHLLRKRVDMALTNTQLAQMLGVAYQTIERWEHNRKPITAKNRQKIVAFLDYDPLDPDTPPSS